MSVTRLNSRAAVFPDLHRWFFWWNIIRWSFLLMADHSFQLLKIRIVQHHSLTMISIRLMIRLMHAKCLFPQNKYIKVTFSRKCTKEDHPPMYFNNTYWTVSWRKTQLQYLHKRKLWKAYKGIRLLRNLSNNIWDIYKVTPWL